MSETESSQFRVPNEGEPIPPVDPEDLKRNWKIQPGDKEALIAERARGLNSSAISKRCWMIRVLTACSNQGQLLAPWQHGVELDDAVFRVAATFPIRTLRQHVYKVPGDEMWGFDPNVFVQKLIEETGISYVWEPVPARVQEGGFSYVTHRVTFKGQGPPDREAANEGLKKFMAPSEREAKHEAQELLWAVWSKFQPHLSRPSRNHEHDVAIVAMRFADFAIDHIGLAREFVSRRNVAEGRSKLSILADLERGAWTL